MRMLLVLSALALFVAGPAVSVSAAPLWRFDETQRLAGSHDGNGFDKDDIGASAFDWAICRAYGAGNKICHFEHSNNLAGSETGDTAHDAMVESAMGGAVRFGEGNGTGFGTTGIVYDFIMQTEACIAHFKTESDKNSATDEIICWQAGPMEACWRELTATAVDKRQYITFISADPWGQNAFIFPGSGMNHLLSSCKAIPGGAKFIEIADQNARLGTSTGMATWEGLKTIGSKNGTSQADWDWLHSRALFKSGDVSDAGMVFFLFSGSENGSADSLINHFNNPLGPTAIHAPIFPAGNLNNTNVNLTHSAGGLTVSLAGSQDNGSVKVYSLTNRLVCTAELLKGSAVLPMANKARGTYVINIRAGNRNMVKHFINR